MEQDEFPRMGGRRTEHRSMLDTIRENDGAATNGGCYVSVERRALAEALVERGEVVRMHNTAGVSPVYVPMDSDHFSDERLERLSERQMEEYE